MSGLLPAADGNDAQIGVYCSAVKNGNEIKLFCSVRPELIDVLFRNFMFVLVLLLQVKTMNVILKSKYAATQSMKLSSEKNSGLSVQLLSATIHHQKFPGLKVREPALYISAMIPTLEPSGKQ